jgi:hypothetical protein
MIKIQIDGIVSTGCLYKSGMKFITIHLQMQGQFKKRMMITMIMLIEKVREKEWNAVSNEVQRKYSG